MKPSLYSALFLCLFLYACTATKPTVNGNDGIINIQFVQINDVYEIAPIEAGKVGGVARVASLKKELKAKNPLTDLIIAGDFLSPSVYNNLSYQGKRVRGRQMVDCLNEAGLDIAAFGNHEFDISESELISRINESKFQWISSNSYHKTKDAIIPFVKTVGNQSQRLPTYIIKTYKDADGTEARLGIMGINIPFNRNSYVEYTDPFETAEKIYNTIKDSCDAVIAITHQDEQDDILLARQLPGIPLIMGGHEHDMRFDKVGQTIISKAHANARSAYVLNLQINKNTGNIKVTPTLRMIDTSIAIDPVTNQTVQKWMQIANENFASLGFDVKKEVMATGPGLDAREASVRSGQTNFTRLLVKAIEAAAPQAQVSIVNSGSIRPDDVLMPPLTQYDVLRTLPFGGGITLVEMKGSLLIQILNAGLQNKGTGGFLQYSEALQYHESQKEWRLNNTAIENNNTYKVAITDFLLTGGESKMDFLTKKNPLISKIYPVATSNQDPMADIRVALIQYLQKQ